jgi:surfactin synthase thioesterase subunit
MVNHNRFGRATETVRRGSGSFFQPPRPAADFAPWIKRQPGPAGRAGQGAIIVFPHAGAAASSYRTLATALAAGGDTFVVQYPRRAERLNHPAPQTIHDLAHELFQAGPWHRAAPLRLFGHSMGALVAFEFARIAEQHRIPVHKLWVSAGPVPSSVAALPELPTSTSELLADLARLGGTDPRLLADEEFAQLMAEAARCDYEALNRYECSDRVRIRADIHAFGGRSDNRVDAGSLRRWAHHTNGSFGMSLFDGGHFFINEHTNTAANRVITDV